MITQYILYVALKNRNTLLLVLFALHAGLAVLVLGLEDPGVEPLALGDRAVELLMATPGQTHQLAAQLVARGHEVTIVERDAIPGGRAGMVESNGYLLDNCPTVMKMPNLLEDVFNAVVT